jgi:hypothetical protein
VLASYLIRPDDRLVLGVRWTDSTVAAQIISSTDAAVPDRSAQTTRHRHPGSARRAWPGRRPITHPGQPATASVPPSPLNSFESTDTYNFTPWPIDPLRVGALSSPPVSSLKYGSSE